VLLIGVLRIGRWRGHAARRSRRWFLVPFSKKERKMIYTYHVGITWCVKIFDGDGRRGFPLISKLQAYSKK